MIFLNAVVACPHVLDVFGRHGVVEAAGDCFERSSPICFVYLSKSEFKNVSKIAGEKRKGHDVMIVVGTVTGKFSLRGGAGRRRTARPTITLPLR